MKNTSSQRQPSIGTAYFNGETEYLDMGQGMANKYLNTHGPKALYVNASGNTKYGLSSGFLNFDSSSKIQQDIDAMLQNISDQEANQKDLEAQYNDIQSRIPTVPQSQRMTLITQANVKQQQIIQLKNMIAGLYQKLSDLKAYKTKVESMVIGDSTDATGNQTTGDSSGNHNIISTLFGHHDTKGNNGNNDTTGSSKEMTTTSLGAKIGIVLGIAGVVGLIGWGIYKLVKR